MFKTKLLNKIDIYIEKKYFPYILIAIAASIAYCNSFTVPFHLDDFGSIANNYSIHELFLFSEMWKFYANRIVLYFTLSLNYVLLGNHLGGYHAVNLLIHISNGILLYNILMKLLSLPCFKNSQASTYRRVMSLMASLLFICHPMQVNAVTYIIQRTASLAAAFYLLSVDLYLGYRITGKSHKLVLVILSAIAAMFTKENTITIPFMLLLTEIMFFSGDNRLKPWRKVLAFLLIFLTLSVIPATNILFHGHSLSDPNITFKASTTMDRLKYFYTQLNVLLHYIRLLIIPVGQCFDYSNDYPISASLRDNYSYISLAVLLFILAFAFFLAKRNRLAAFGIFWFFISISVESSFISIKDVYFEHRVYLPSAGFFMFLSGIITYERKAGKSNIYLFHHPVSVFLYASLVLIPVYTGLTLYRNYIYSDSIRLWSNTVKKASNSDRAHNSLATAYLNDYDESKGNTENLEIAEKEFKAALEIDESNGTAHCNLSKVYLLKGMYPECISEAKRALDLSRTEYACYNLGSAYAKCGRIDEALSSFLKGYGYNHRSSFILKALGDTYYESGDFENAGKYYREYVENNKMYENTRVNERLNEIDSCQSVRLPYQTGSFSTSPS